MDVKIYKNHVPDNAIDIRIKVFTDEQGFVDGEDETDNVSVHFVAFDGDVPVGTCRVFERAGEILHVLGRLAVLKEYRKKGVGRELLSEAEKYVASVGGIGIILHAQVRAVEFYERCGYTGFGEIEDEEGYPHLWMKKIVKEI